MLLLSLVFNYSHLFNLIAKIYIGVMVFSMGVIILSLRYKKIKLSMKRIIAIGAVAGFNKGISAGGYGPLTVSGQLLSGREGKNAIASTSFSETLICVVGVLAYILTTFVESRHLQVPIDWSFLGIAPYLIIGAIFAAPLAALFTNKVKGEWLKVGVGCATIFIGLFSLVRIALIETGVWDRIPSFVNNAL